MSKLPIIVHVPKTGGTTLFMAVSGSPSPPKANTLYRHVLMNESKTEMRSNCADLFDESAIDNYANQQIILMIRDPLERLESEFGFLGNRSAFRNLWEVNVGCEFPKTFLEYVSHQTTSNSICKFLLGYHLFGKETIGDHELDQIVSQFDKLEFVFGLTKEMSATVLNVEHRCKKKFGDSLPRYRTSLYKPKRDETWQEIESTFNKLNKADLALVDTITVRFHSQIAEIPEGREISFKGDIYDSLYMFMCGHKLRSPLEIYANDLSNPEVLYDWVNERNAELEIVLKDLLPRYKGDGKSFLVAWLKQSIPTFLDGKIELDINTDDPLVTLRTLAERMFST